MRITELTPGCHGVEPESDLLSRINGEDDSLPRDIRIRIARTGLDSSDRRGRHHWVEQRTRAWCNRKRRLIRQVECCADLDQAVLTLGCAFICLAYNALP